MLLVWTDNAWDEYINWLDVDKKMLRKINNLINTIKKTPFEGIGKPESLKFALRGKWSRRINDEHRLVYSMEDKQIIIYQCKYHY